MHSLTKRRSWAPLLALGLVLAGCGASASAGTASSSPTATATATSLPTPTATATTTPSPVTLPCANSPLRGDAHPLPDSDFVVVGPSLDNLTYPGVQLHEGTPSAPLLLGTRSVLPYASVVVNPNLNPGGGYEVLLCNGSPSRSHQVTSISVRIESLTPFTGKLLEWPGCQYAYSRSFPGNGGCGGGNYYDERVVATFPANAPAGTTEPATLQYAGQTNAQDATLPPYGPLPATVGPGRGIFINVGMQMTDPAATYTFSVGVSLDGAPPVFSQPTDPVLLAPVAQEWTGAACQAPTMQAQIPPATNPPTYYICPAS